jgi:hypothetical protein
MSKSLRENPIVWPKTTDVYAFLKLQRAALRKAKTPGQREKIKMIIEEFEKIKDML